MPVDDNSEKGQSLDETKNDSPIAPSCSKEKEADIHLENVQDSESSIMEYRLYKRRFAGITALVRVFVLIFKTVSSILPVFVEHRRSYGVAVVRAHF